MTACGCGILAGPIAYAIDLQLRYALVPVACRAGRHWRLTDITVPLLLIAITGGLLARRGWNVGDEETLVPQRVRFMALGGMKRSAMFSLTIIASAIPDFFLTPCN